MKQTITNPFHGTSTTISPINGIITEAEYKRARRELCPATGCSCMSSAASGEARIIAGAIPVKGGYELAE